ncbi:hypothetical protein BD779DRAFT_1475063 [Infundibulicybe gibba]|nr:hypothetical protein BD779DRAFT_1475063 [Infundibulicybe gibba]
MAYLGGTTATTESTCRYMAVGCGNIHGTAAKAGRTHNEARDTRVVGQWVKENKCKHGAGLLVGMQEVGPEEWQEDGLDMETLKGKGEPASGCEEGLMGGRDGGEGVEVVYTEARAGEHTARQHRRGAIDGDVEDYTLSKEEEKQRCAVFGIDPS